MGFFDIFKGKQPKTEQKEYVAFTEEEKVSGNLDSLMRKIYGNSLIILITGKRGSGKTALGMKFLEMFNKKHKKKAFILGYDDAKVPNWMKKVKSIEEIPNNGIALLDEGAVTFSSRETMKNPNKALGKLMAIARHKGLTLILISQNSAMIDLNVLRLADILLFKEPSLLQSKFERKAIKDMYEKVAPMFKGKDSPKSLFYVWDDEYEGLLKFSLPEFWTEEISKSFKNY